MSDHAYIFRSISTKLTYVGLICYSNKTYWVNLFSWFFSSPYIRKLSWSLPSHYHLNFLMFFQFLFTLNKTSAKLLFECFLLFLSYFSLQCSRTCQVDLEPTQIFWYLSGFELILSDANQHLSYGLHLTPKDKLIAWETQTYVFKSKFTVLTNVWLLITPIHPLYLSAFLTCQLPKIWQHLYIETKLTNMGLLVTHRFNLYPKM